MFRKELIGNPGNLSNEDIQQIGQKHLYKKYSVTVLFKKTVDESAETLMNYNVENTPQEKWLFLAKHYKTLPNVTDLIAADIKNLFVKAFKIDESVLKRTEKFHTITFSGFMENKIVEYFKNKKKFILASNASAKITLCEVNSVNALTNSNVNDIGTSYFQNYGNKPSFLSGLFHIHTNHQIAKKLQECNEEKCKDRWLFIANAYKLPNNRGVIATQIRKYFVDAFKPTTYELEDVPYMATTADMVREMKSLITNHYDNKIHIPEFHPIDGIVEMADNGKKYAGGLLLKSAFSSLGFDS